MQASLTLLVGAPGSGKSTHGAAMERDGYIVLSSDAMRAVLGSGEDDQSVSAAVFRVMETMAAYFLSRGQRVVIDALNYRRRSRKTFIDIAWRYNAKVRAIHFLAGREVCLSRNAQRPRVVPESVIERVFENFEAPDFNEVDELFLI